MLLLLRFWWWRQGHIDDLLLLLHWSGGTGRRTWGPASPPLTRRTCGNTCRAP
jgi:hypothetical protein